jgi:hypothetical protein
VTCNSASITPLKPTGVVWDSLSGPPPATLPDTTCTLELADGRERTTAVVMDSLTPTWNASVTPLSGGSLTTKLLTSMTSHWRITLTDMDVSGSELVCTTLPVATAADLRKGTLTVMNAGSCNSITLGFTCADGH